MFNFARHYVILPRIPRVRYIAGAIKNKTQYSFYIFFNKFLTKIINHTSGAQHHSYMYYVFFYMLHYFFILYY